MTNDATDNTESTSVSLASTLPVATVSSAIVLTSSKAFVGSSTLVNFTFAMAVSVLPDGSVTRMLSS